MCKYWRYISCVSESSIYIKIHPKKKCIHDITFYVENSPNSLCIVSEFDVFKKFGFFWRILNVFKFVFQFKIQNDQCPEKNSKMYWHMVKKKENLQR